MHTLTENLRFHSTNIRHALALEPRIRLNLAHAGAAEVVTVIYCLVLKGVGAVSAISNYLESHGCNFDRETIEFFLNAFEGEDPRHHMWMRGMLGEYELIHSRNYPFDEMD